MRAWLQEMIWRALVIDFGHELVTSVHTPLKWSNQRPPAGEFESAWADTNLSGTKVGG